MLFLFLLFLLFPSFAHAGLVTSVSSSLGLTNGLVGYWSFDNTKIYGANAYDSSNSFATGTVSGAAKVAGKLGQGLSFNGSSDYVSTVTNQASLDFGVNQDFTIATWVKTTQPSEAGFWAPFVSKEDQIATRQGYALLLHDNDASGKWYIETFVAGAWDGAYGRSNIADGRWHYLVAGRSGSNLFTYEDGVLGEQIPASTGSLQKDAPLKIGGGFGNDFNGSIDDVRIYNRALSAAEISDLYQSGAATIKAPTRTGLVGSGNLMKVAERK